MVINWYTGIYPLIIDFLQMYSCDNCSEGELRKEIPMIFWQYPVYVLRSYGLLQQLWKTVQPIITTNISSDYANAKVSTSQLSTEILSRK